MYYEEKIISGKWFCRNTPDGEWLLMDVLVLSSNYTASKLENEALRKKIIKLEDRFDKLRDDHEGFELV